MAVDLEKKLVFPGIVQTNLRPDIVLWSETGKKLVVIKLTVPWETRRKRPMRGRRPSTLNYLSSADTEVGGHGFSLSK